MPAASSGRAATRFPAAFTASASPSSTPCRSGSSPRCYRDGKTYRQEFTRGVPDYDMKTIGISQETGTLISFLPDAEIFEEIDWSTDTLSQSLRETAFLTRGLRITLTDERAGGQQFEYHYEGGIRDFVAHVNEAKDPDPQAHRLLRGRERRGRSRGRDAVEHEVRASRSSRSPTTSTRTRAARISRASTLR